MTKKSLIAGSLAAIAMLSGCGSTGVLDRDRPDEFAVTKARPLTVPSQFDLPAPQPEGSQAPADSKAQVLDALFGPSSAGQ